MFKKIARIVLAICLVVALCATQDRSVAASGPYYVGYSMSSCQVAATYTGSTNSSNWYVTAAAGGSILWCALPMDSGATFNSVNATFYSSVAQQTSAWVKVCTWTQSAGSTCGTAMVGNWSTVGYHSITYSLSGQSAGQYTYAAIGFSQIESVIGYNVSHN